MFHTLLALQGIMDGRDKPGHDEQTVCGLDAGLGIAPSLLYA
jgi:hypothetical protein